VTHPLLDFLRDRIAEHGPMPFAAYMSHVLYHPRFGYYAAGPERSGWRGHFLTSPELDPAFGRLWAGAFQEIWVSSGRPAPFAVVEIGPGEGGFVRAVLDAVEGPFSSALAYVLVERIPALEERQRKLLSGFERLEWRRSITEVAPVGAGVVVANEVVDNLPVHLVEARGGAVAELCVTVDGDALGFVARPPSSPELERFLARVGVALPDGHRMEVPLAAESLMTRAAAVVETGAVIVVDYGATATDLAERPGGTLVAYSGAGADDAVLDAPGTKDVTAHANWTALAGAMKSAGLAVAGPAPQREVLRALGLSELDRELRAAHEAATAAGRGAEAVRALSRRQALAALADPGGLGGLEVLVGAKAIPVPAFMTEKRKDGPG
jgi:SAM-dependent MidA family methyltransferase